MMGQTGAGGYGGISTQNQDQRGPKYGPHILLSKFLEMGEVWHIHCMTCGQSWRHMKDKRTFPKKCKKL